MIPTIIVTGIKRLLRLRPGQRSPRVEPWMTDKPVKP
jgi:hypothetical protein